MDFDIHVALLSCVGRLSLAKLAFMHSAANSEIFHKSRWDKDCVGWIARRQ